MKECFTPSEDDKPKDAEIMPFRADSDCSFSAKTLNKSNTKSQESRYKAFDFFRVSENNADVMNESASPKHPVDSSV